MNSKAQQHLRWISWGVLCMVFVVAGYARWWALPPRPHDFKETSAVAVLQAVFLAAACVMCIVAMVRAGIRQADFYWWVAPAFITFFMFWREAEIDSDMPGISLSLTVLVVCLKRLGLLLAAA